MQRKYLAWVFWFVTISTVFIIPLARGNKPEILWKMDKTESQDRYPIFANCPKHEVEVMENMPIGTSVMQMMANNQGQVNHGGKIRYSIGSTSQFAIDYQTGVLKTKKKFDRDEPVSEKAFYITVFAIDDSFPPMWSSCVINITIIGSNDNPPIFDKMSYYERVPMNFSVGDLVMRISATDIDEDRNSFLIYSIHNPKSSSWDDKKYFRIDSKTGEIFLNKTIDEAPGYTFRLTAVVEDCCSQPLFAITIIEIRVVKSHLKRPSFKFSKSHLRIPETNETIGILTLEAESNLKNNPNVSFELVSGTTEQSNKEKTFRLETLREIANLVLCGPLDYERISKYSLIIRVTNSQNMTAETTIIVDIEKVNIDNGKKKTF